IARRTLAARQESTRIITERFAKGYVAEVDKLQAEQQEALAAVTIPAFERQIITIENSMRILMGMGPGRIPRGQTLYQQQISPEIPAGLPSQLLLRRPDIREAERRLEAEFNRIGVAKASLYPSLNLTGLLGFASPSLTTFLGTSGFVANGFANLVGPIFQWGQNKRRIRITEYRTEQAFRSYEQTVLTAFGDVDNALAQYRTYSQEYEVRHQLVMAARKALELTEAKYNYGYSSYYEVLIQQNYLFDAELAESTTLQQKINSLVFLYKSLGGGWQ
ncbi:MAG TPA: TolC family protein, partial [Phnomibacter sp.]|nr:TolC family protein [Phnomibacter sp.]